MLLHVVVTARPVDLAADDRSRPCPGERPLKHVGDAIILVDDIDDRNALQGSCVVRLAARRRVERRAVEVCPLSLVRKLDDRRVEHAKHRVRVVEALGHRAGGVGESPRRQATHR